MKVHCIVANITEPWGVRRFYVRDPFGKLVNILQHVPKAAGE